MYVHRFCINKSPLQSTPAEPVYQLKMWKERIKTNFHGQDVPYDMYCNATAVLNIGSDIRNRILVCFHRFYIDKITASEYVFIIFLIKTTIFWCMFIVFASANHLFKVPLQGDTSNV